MVIKMEEDKYVTVGITQSDYEALKAEAEKNFRSTLKQLHVILVQAGIVK